MRAADWPSLATRNAAAKELDLGESAPDWLVQSETYSEAPIPDDWEALAASKVAFVTHCPVNREYFRHIHALGIRAFPYVSFYQGFAGLTWEGVRLEKHPEYIEIDKDGNLKRTSFWESEDAKNMYVICPAVAEFQDAMVAWVRKIMELGADGVFLDNLSSRAACFGPQFRKHKHLTNDANQAFALLLKRVRELIKQYKPDGALLGNSADPSSLPREYFRYLDADMLESYICTWVSTERWFDWEQHWHQEGTKQAQLLRAGKQIQALSYVGHTPYGIREDAFFCYATARLGGFVWCAGQPISTPETAILYQIRLGPPQGPEKEDHGVYYRLFERGFVVVNPNKTQPAELTLPDLVSSTFLYDIFTAAPGPAASAPSGAVDRHASAARRIDLTATGRRLKIPAYAGRVYLYAPPLSDELSKPGPTLTVATDPPLAEVHFRLDGFDYWTHAGHWTTKYVTGPDFGRFSITFDEAGQHKVEIIDVVPADMKTSAGYGKRERLGQFMDPSQPTRPSAGRKFHFREWAGPAAGREPSVHVDVKENTTLSAKFDVEEKKP